MGERSAHSRSFWNKYRQRLSTLFAVTGLMSLVIGAIIALSSFAKYEYERGRFLWLGLYFVFGGTAVLALRFLTITLPDILNDRSSAVVNRRRIYFQSRQKPKPSPSMLVRNDQGSILIIVLILLGLVSVMAMRAIVAARSSQKEVAAAIKMGLLQLAAIDTARTAMQQLADDPDLKVDGINEKWAEGQEFIDPSGVTRIIRIEDAQQSFDLNNLAVQVTGEVTRPSEALASIMVLCGVYTPGQQVDALMDWIDDDQTGVYETPFYQKKTASYSSADRILTGWDELFQTEGWSSELFVRRPVYSLSAMSEANLIDHITIIPVPRNRIIPLNINTAGAAALQGVLGFGSEVLVEQILNRRKEKPFQSTDFLTHLLGEKEFLRVAPYLDVKSVFFQIQATAFADGKTARLELLAQRASDGSMRAVRSYFQL